MKEHAPDLRALQNEIETLRAELKDCGRTDQSLRESEERYRRITSAITDYIYTVYLEEGFPVRTVHSPACEAVTGYTPGEFDNDPYLWFNMVYEDDQDMVRDHIRQVLSNIDAQPIEHRIKRKDGAVRWVSNTPVIHRDSSGAMVSYDGVLSDITIRKLAEEGLRESEIRFRVLHEASFGGIGIHDKGLILDCNQGLSDMTGYPREELIGMDGLTVLIAPEWRDFVRENILSGFEKPYDVIGLRKDGSSYPLEICGKSLPYHGKMVRVTEFRDISDRKQAEEALRRSEERFRSMIQNSTDMIVVLNQEGSFVYETPSVSRILGYDQGRLMGRKPAEFIHPDDLETTVLDLQGVYEGTSDGLPTEMRFRKSDGSWASLEAIGKNLLDFPGINGVVITARDITDRKKAEEERIEMERRFQHAQKLESLGILAGGIAHDFNNLLMAILGNLDLAISDIHEVARAEHFIGQARTAARRAADLTNQMLAYSGKGRFNLKAFDLSMLVEEMARLLKASISKAVSLSLELDRSLPLITADPAQIRQIVMNLIVNAAEAIQDGNGSVTISTGVREFGAEELSLSRLKEKPVPGHFVYLCVKDTGCGMDEATLQKLFDPFFTTKFTGRGLGMAAVQGIVTGHKGAILVESSPGIGTTVTVLIPSVVSPGVLEEKGDELSSCEGEEAQMPRVSGTVLVVDDEEMVLDLCSTMVERMGFSVLASSDGKDALEVFRGHTDEIVCVILDLTMPRMDGITTFEALRRIRSDVRVIISSGYSEEEMSQRFQDNRPAGFIKKPFTFRVLRRELARILRKC